MLAKVARGFCALQLLLAEFQSVGVEMYIRQLQGLMSEVSQPEVQVQPENPLSTISKLTARRKRNSDLESSNIHRVQRHGCSD